MADADNITVHVQVDVGNMEDKLSELKDGLTGIKNLVANIQQSISQVSVYSEQIATKVGTGLSSIGTTVSTSVGTLTNALTTVSTEVTSKLGSILDAINDVVKAQEDGKAIEKFANLATGLNDSSELVKNIPEFFNKSGESPKGNYGKNSAVPKTNNQGQLLLPAAGESSYGKTTGDDGSSLGLVSGGLMDLGSSLPSPESLIEMATCIGDVAIKLKESAVAWGQELAAKVASRAEDLKIIAVNTVEHVKSFGIMIGQLAASAAAWVAETAAKVANTAAQWAQIAATTAWQAICVAATAVTTAFGAAVNFLTSPIGLVVIAITALIAIVVLLVKNWDTVKAAALSVWETIKGAFGKAWEWFKTTLLDPLSEGFKGTVNGIIGFINGLITGAVKGINGIISLLNKLQFTVPDWVPGLGGKSLGFNIKTITAPQIPYLAKGAVLPANKPFLAVVGDQRHGTNVEAPLATIQEAVALVMDDHISAMMAGFEALLQEQRAIRQTVEGIEIGDTVIGRAAQRYNRKMAIVKGGY